MGMVGGGPGAFIGPVHKMAAELDGKIELVAGAFSQSAERSREAGEGFGIDPGQGVCELRGDDGGGAEAAGRDRLCGHRYAESFASADGCGCAGGGVSGDERQAGYGHL